MCDTGFDSVLTWMEYHADRLDQDIIGVRAVPCPGIDIELPALVLYPNPLPKSPPTQGVQVVSRAVTRGVEVVASAVYSPLLRAVQMGFIYSIRIRLLTPEDGDEYVSPADRGFERCRLETRNYRITDEEWNHTNRVNGEGVEGMFPDLFEGGYQLGNARPRVGTFEFQSSTGRMGKGHFEGEIRFVVTKSATEGAPTGETFEVAVAPFLLDPNPQCWY